MPIDTREELINALHEACEVEHALLVQYLYAALSMKKSLGEGLTPRQQSLAREWEAEILLIAREEMGHFAIVCNLLAAIGAPAKFHRPALPRAIDYYPFPFDLVPFSDEALYRFLVFELPRDHPLPPPPNADLSEEGLLEAVALAPEPISYKFIGELYAAIAEGFATIPEAELFIGPPEAQTGQDWSDRSLDILAVADRQTALAAIEEIIEDGEGTETNRDNSHFNRFARVRKAYFDEGRFEAARAVVRNPATRDDPEVSGSVTPITNEDARRVAELFNSAYGLMLLLLQLFFSMAPSGDDRSGQGRRRALQLASQRLMSVAVRPIAEILTQLPAADPQSPGRAGPPFEIYSDISPLPYEPARWVIPLERFDSLAAECAALAADHPRLAELGETLAIMRDDLALATLGAS